MKWLVSLGAAVGLLGLPPACAPAAAQTSTQIPAPAPIEIVRPGPTLDPSRSIQHPRTVAGFHRPLPEQYIWTAQDAAVANGVSDLSRLKRDDWKVEPHCFRRSFDVAALPARATLYVAGPRGAKVWINGTLAATLTFTAGHHMGFGTMSAEVAPALRVGANVIAVEAVRGFGSHHHTNALKTSWLNSGEVLALKIVPAASGVDLPPLLISDAQWKSKVAPAQAWQQPGLDDSAWPPVAILGGIESSPDFFQWNADAGMYAWPGYLGEAPYMANYRLQPIAVTGRPDGTLLDFGREISGRIVVLASPGAARQITIRMGESMGELLHAPYLGEIVLSAPAGGEARGPKTGFRYALVESAPGERGSDVLAEGIFYPSPQVGSFESSDPQVNRIFETAVYTAHLSMQDSILDGIKRDRGRWIGDDEVIHRVTMDLYGDARLVKAGLEDAIGPEPVTAHVNGLPGYSAWWVVSEWEYFERSGDLQHLRSVKSRLLQLLDLMERELDARSVYAGKGKPFVDWSQGFSGDSPEARRAVHFEYVLAFRRAASLLHAVGDRGGEKKYTAVADAMSEAAAKYLEDPDGSFGDRWQTNAIFSLSGLRSPLKVPDTAVVWPVLKRTVTGRKTGDVITPYFGSYLLQALARIGGGLEALQWMKSYWGGMLDNGATSFWEAWDPAWAGDDPHARLEADDKVGYNASLAHGWSSGPAAFLLEDVLGVTPASPGYRSVDVHPRLAGLEWVKGSVATPLGAVAVEASATRILLTIPGGMAGNVHLPPGKWTLNGARVDPLKGNGVTQLANGETVVTVARTGRFEFLKQ